MTGLSNETFFTIYKTTNQLNEKIYIGKHQTLDLEDNYLGSGKCLKYAFENMVRKTSRKKSFIFLIMNKK